MSDPAPGHLLAGVHRGRNVFVRLLGLQREGGRGDDDAGLRITGQFRQRRRQVTQRFAGSGAGLHEQVFSGLEGGAHLGDHLDLAGALLMIDPAVVPPTWRRGLLLPLAPHLLRRRLPIARSAGRRRDHFGSAAEALASYRGRGAFKTWKPGFLDDYVEDGFAPQPDGSVRLRCSPAWESATFAGHRHDTFAALRALRVPARLMAAEKGSTTVGLLPMIAQAAPAMAIETVAGCTHFVPMERPELVRERMIEMMNAG